MTLVGVMIGVAALISLLSYGSGLQRNTQQEFNAFELYNTLRVTSRPASLVSFADVSFRDAQAINDTMPEVELTDALIAEIGRIPGVLSAYPEVIFPVRVRTETRELAANAEAIPMNFNTIPAYQPVAGKFFATPLDSAIMMSPSMARRLGFDPPELAVGEIVQLTTATINWRAIQSSAFTYGLGLRSLPIQERDHSMVISGLLQEDGQPLSGFLRVLMPIDLAQQMRKITFFSTFDLLMSRSSSEGYNAIRIQLSDMEAYPDVRAQIEERGVFVTSFREQFEQIGRVFLMLDMALGIIGVIALLVASIGIANTMMMNVMERYREIGIMKALGGDERDLKRLFLFESSLLGLTGALLGIGVGWAVNSSINVSVNFYLSQQGIPWIDLFHMPLSLILSVLGIAVLISLVAGFAPAHKAARVEPIQALRHV